MSACRTATLVLLVAVSYGLAASPAAAFNPLKPACGVVGIASPAAGNACKTAAGTAGSLTKAGGKLATGQVGGAVSTLVSGGAALGLSAIEGWVLGGASFALHETARLIGESTVPQLGTTWFSSTYWRMAGIAAVLTLPFLFAAVVQALLRSDLALLARAALGYLPLAMLSVSIAAPMTMLLLAASDQMSAVVSSAAGNSGARYLARAAGTLGGLAPFPGAPFLAFLVGLFTAAGAVVLWFELLMRDAAVYVIVLMLPLAFAAMVWPARRIWVVRAVELLVALIFSKFVIVSVLSLGGAALSGGGQGVAGWLAGLVILALGAFAPWAMLRLLPLAELASSAAGSMRGEGRVGRALGAADRVAHSGHEWATAMTGQMRRELAAVSEELRGGADAGTDRHMAPDSSAATEDSSAALATDPGEGFAVAQSASGDSAAQSTSEASKGSPRGGEPWKAEDKALGTLVLGEQVGGGPPRFPGQPPVVTDRGDQQTSALGGAPQEAPEGASPPPPAAIANVSPSSLHSDAGGTLNREGSQSAVSSHPGQDDPDPLPAAQDPPDGRL